MVERSRGARFVLETTGAIRIIYDQSRNHLDRDVAAEPGIARTVDLSHPAHRERGDDLVRAEASTVGEAHPLVRWCAGAGWCPESETADTSRASRPAS
jgi:hypothetical protein